YRKGGEVTAELIGREKYPHLFDRFTEETITKNVMEKFSATQPELIDKAVGDPMPESLRGQLKYPELHHRYTAGVHLHAEDVARIKHMAPLIEALRLSKNKPGKMNIPGELRDLLQDPSYQQEKAA